MMHSRLLVKDSNRRIFNIDRHIGMVVIILFDQIICGHIPDGKNVVNRARREAQAYRDNYGTPITGKVLTERVAGYVHAHTLYSYYRNLGVGIMIATYDNGKYSLFSIDNTGNFYVMYL